MKFIKARKEAVLTHRSASELTHLPQTRLMGKNSTASIAVIPKLDIDPLTTEIQQEHSSLGKKGFSMHDPILETRIKNNRRLIDQALKDGV